MISFQEEYSILDILPNKQDSILNKRKQKHAVLSLFSSLLDLAIESIDAFLQKEFQQFDAQVGENLCQIRAYKILLLASDELFPHRELHPNLRTLRLIKDKVVDAIKVFEKAIEQSSRHNALLDKKEPLNEFFENHGIQQTLSENMIFIIFSYFLHKFCMKKDEAPIAVDYGKINKTFFWAKHTSKKVVYNYQTHITQIGCRYILKFSKNFNPIRKKILSRLLKISDEGRYVLPCHEATDLILQDMIGKALPLFLVVNFQNSIFNYCNQIAFFCRGTNFVNEFTSEKNISHLPKSTPIMIVRGISETGILDDLDRQRYIKDFLRRGVTTVLLANTAMHPQYSGNKLFSFRENPFQHILASVRDTYNNDPPHPEVKYFENRLMSHKKIAIEQGYCKENAAFFYLKHIYSAPLQHCLDLSPSMEEIFLCNDFEHIAFKVPSILK